MPKAVISFVLHIIVAWESVPSGYIDENIETEFLKNFIRFSFFTSNHTLVFHLPTMLLTYYTVQILDMDMGIWIECRKTILTVEAKKSMNN